MATTTLSVIENGSPTVTEKQLELVRSTVAKNATAEQLELYLYDCERQGVHPLIVSCIAQYEAGSMCLSPLLI